MASIAGKALAALQRLRRDRRGVSAVEFALTAPFVFAAIFGIYETGRLYWIDNTLQFAAEAAARYGMVHQGASDQDVTNVAKSQAVGVSADAMTIQISSDTISGVQYLTVAITYPFNVAIPFIPQDLITLTARSRVPRVFPS